MTAGDLLARLRRRGGELRLLGERLQYRPPGVLTPAELDWLRNHQPEIAGMLAHPAPVDDAVVPAGPALGVAGPETPAWHCRIDLRSRHLRAIRPDGTAYCATCHPSTVLTPRRPA
jgi:hypothetical protein